jgi:hypothetical protein
MFEKGRTAEDISKVINVKVGLVIKQLYLVIYEALMIKLLSELACNWAVRDHLSARRDKFSLRKLKTTPIL